MRTDQIRELMRKQPFRPFRLFLSDGATYDVRHPELVMVTLAFVAVGLNGGDGDLAETLALLDPIHITRIEPLKGGPKSGGLKRRKRGR
jgi:hypothetical protein